MDGWNIWGEVLALYVVMPLLIAAMAASGWARERSLGTLDWLRARPLSGPRLFAARAAAVALPALLWTAAAIAIHRAGAIDVELVLSTVPGLPGALLLFVVQLLLALGAGLLVSALAPSAESAFRWSVSIVVAAWLAALVLSRSAADAAVLVEASSQAHSHLLDGATAAFLLAVAGALLLGAWTAIGRAVEGTRARRRAITIAGGGSVAAAVAFLLVLHLPLLAGAESSHALWLGEDRGLVFAPARGVGPGLASAVVHPIVREGGRSRIARSAFVLSPGPWSKGPWTHPATGRALMYGYLDRPWLMEADGHAIELETADANLSPGAETTPAGWSPSGNHFAWLQRRWSRSDDAVGTSARRGASRLLVLDPPQRSVRSIAMPDVYFADARVAWIDADRLLVTDGYGHAGIRRSWWIVDAPQGTITASRALDAGRLLTAPPLVSWPVSATRLPRLAGRAVAILAPDGSTGTRLWVNESQANEAIENAAAESVRLVAIDAAAGVLEPGPMLGSLTSAVSLGTLDDGSLVWAEPSRPFGPPQLGADVQTAIYDLASFDAEPRQLCTVPHGRAGAFLGQTGQWAIWDTVAFLPYELWGCNVATGEVRRIDEWQTWAHPRVSIGPRGIFTPAGWMSLRD